MDTTLIRGISYEGTTWTIRLNNWRLHALTTALIVQLPLPLRGHVQRHSWHHDLQSSMSCWPETRTATRHVRVGRAKALLLRTTSP